MGNCVGKMPASAAGTASNGRGAFRYEYSQQRRDKARSPSSGGPEKTYSSFCD